MNDMTTPLSINNLSIKIGEDTILNKLSLEIKKHEFVTLMGENGAGKTMLIDSLMGFRKPNSGSIKFFGQELKGNARESINKMVGWVPSHQENYLPGLNVRDFFQSISELYPSWDDGLVKKLGESFQLNFGKKMNYLSLCERSKVKLIKALAFHPQLIILDELTANLSPASKEVILEAIIDLFSSSELSVLYVSHFEDEASKLSDRIVTLSGLGELTHLRSNHE